MKRAVLAIGLACLGPLGPAWAGYQDGLQRAGLKLTKSLVKHGDNSFAAGERAGRELLKRKHPPTAIFACNDDMAAGVMRVAYEMGMRVPDQLSLAGFDDIALARMPYPALTTVRQPVAAMAACAAELLLAQIHSKRPPQGAETLPSTLKIRESTGPAPATSKRAAGSAQGSA